MNGPLHPPEQLIAYTVPVEFQVLDVPPLLLPGESLDRYLALRHAVLADIAPRCAAEWLLAMDFAELSWEIQRYRILRHKLLTAYRQKAVEASLRHIDMMGIRPEFEDQAGYYTIQNALSWRLDPTAATEIEARLASYGIDQQSLNMEVYVQVGEVLSLFEGLLRAAELRRMHVLKEIKSRAR